MNSNTIVKPSYLTALGNRCAFQVSRMGRWFATSSPQPFHGPDGIEVAEKNSFALLLSYNHQDISDLPFGTSHPEFHDGPFTSHPIYPENAST